MTVKVADGVVTRRGVLALAMIMVALNLRATLASVSPLLGELRAAFDLDAARAGFLTMLPLLSFGGFGLFAAATARRLGAEVAVMTLLVTLAGGVAMRSFGSAAFLYTGTLLAGGSIGMLNVIMPSLIKRDFPDRVGLAMSLYSATLCVSGAIGAGLTAPIAVALGGGWQWALAAWVLPVVAAGLLWLPRVSGGVTRLATARPPAGLWRSRLAWMVTLFMGLQSGLFYMVLAWLPTILRERGFGLIESGFALSLSVFAQILTALIVPVIAARVRSQGAIAVASIVLTLVGFTGCLYAPVDTVTVWALILGLGQGAALAIALMFMVLRSSDSAQAAGLSGMAQSVGYTLAAFGPLAIGAARDLSGGWTGAALLFLAVGVVAIGVGLGAGRPLTIPRV